MDYKDLANLIFPDVKDISYYEEMYPERNLKEGAVVTRFAPSPTGFVHIGGLYQALCAKMEALKTEGVFYLRIEDICHFYISFPRRTDSKTKTKICLNHWSSGL